MRTFFSIEEFTQSDTADRLGIDNTPTPNDFERIYETIDFLDMIRGWWGSPIIITSGYRCTELNAAVGGVRTSAHQIGYAADLYPKNGDFNGFVKAVRDFVDKTHVKYDQIILEGSHGKKWLHVALKNIEGAQRCQWKVINK